MDIINYLSGTAFEERTARAQATENAQKSFEALLEGKLPERFALAAFVAGLHRSPAADFYLDLLGDESPQLLEPVGVAIRAGIAAGGRGPVGGEAALWFSTASLPDAAALGERLIAAFDFAHFLVFHPVDSAPERLAPLARVFTADETVTLAQLISFLAFQLRVVQGLAVLGGSVTESTGHKDEVAASVTGAAPLSGKLTGGRFDVLSYLDLVEPQKFVHHSLGWKPWVPDLDQSELTETHLDAMVQPQRAQSAYFRLLARDPAALKARTLTDLDIFYNTQTGIGRAERELAATVASRYNGCIFCASVHSARALEESEGRQEDIERLLAEGPGADLGSERWGAIAVATVALTRTPIAFGQEQVQELRSAGLDTADIIDIINAGAFFNWANRLMLTLGAPELPRRFR